MPRQGSLSHSAQLGMLRAMKRARPVARGLGALAEPVYRRSAHAVWKELLPAEAERLLEADVLPEDVVAMVAEPGFCERFARDGGLCVERAAPLEAPAPELDLAVVSPPPAIG